MFIMTLEVLGFGNLRVKILRTARVKSSVVPPLSESGRQKYTLKKEKTAMRKNHPCVYMVRNI
jgi:hypothetical protein